MARKKAETPQETKAPIARRGTSALVKSEAASKTLKGFCELKLDKHVVPLTKKHINAVWPVVPVGNIKFEYLLGGGFDADGNNRCPGFPRGRITNLYGSAASGKTSISLQSAAAVIAQGGTVLYLDFEHALDVRYAARLGVPIHDSKRFMLVQPDHLEEGIAMICTAANMQMDLIIVDSVGAAMPKAVWEEGLKSIAEGGSRALGLLARTWGQYLPLICNYLKRGGSAMIAIAQQRENISPMAKTKTVVGGNAWKYYAAMRIDMQAANKITGTVVDPLTNKSVKAMLGRHIQVRVDKSKVSHTSGAAADIECVPDLGFDPVRAVFDVAVSHGIVKQSGAWFTWNHPTRGEIRFQGKQGLLTAIRAESQLKAQLETAVRPRLRGVEEASLLPLEESPEDTALYEVSDGSGYLGEEEDAEDMVTLEANMKAKGVLEVDEAEEAEASEGESEESEESEESYDEQGED